MIDIILLLLGGDYVRRRWALLAALGITWLAAGVWLCIDALDGVLYFPLEIFALLVLLESLIALTLARSGLSRAPRLRLIQASALALIALLILSPWSLGKMVLALLLAAAFALDGATRIVTAWHVRFPGWRVTLLGGVLLIVLAITVAAPWPIVYVDTVPYCIGVGLIFSGIIITRLAFRLRHWPPHSTLATQLVHRRTGADLELPPVPPTPPGHTPLVVHVWTALGTAVDPIHRPLLDRYIAAVDAKGTISTGHAALGLRTSISATTPRSRSTTRPPSSCICSAPRPTTTCPAASSPATPSNRPNGARPPAASPSGASTRRGCAPSGGPIGRTRPTT